MIKKDCFIYKNKHPSGQAIYNFDGKYLTDIRVQEIVYTYTIFKIYGGTKLQNRNLLYSCNGKHLYKGPDFNSTEVLLTFDDVHIFRGSSFNPDDILFTYTHNHIYKGNSNKPEHMIFTMNELIPECLLAIILMREGYLKFD